MDSLTPLFPYINKHRINYEYDNYEGKSTLPLKLGCTYCACLTCYTVAQSSVHAKPLSGCPQVALEWEYRSIAPLSSQSSML